MKIIPVLDLKEGRVVRGIAGDRKSYQPIKSPFSESSLPVPLATGLSNHLGLNHFYLADLDALAGHPPNSQIYEALSNAGIRLDVDAGFCKLSHLEQAFEAGIDRAIIALETLTDLDFLSDVLSTFGSEKIIFSLDLRQGVPVSPTNGWENRTPLDIAAEAAELGVLNMIILDVAAVGTGSGLTTRSICEQVATNFPEIELISGGGIHSVEEIEKLADQDILAGLLIASLIHQQKLTASMIKRLNEQS
ncbi:MAG: hypothetical protein KDA65_10385 [Planctomycetaceae bacterium]|nr:hypothetical protein [Planctomycetaceae bacterium]